DQADDDMKGGEGRQAETKHHDGFPRISIEWPTATPRRQQASTRITSASRFLFQKRMMASSGRHSAGLAESPRKPCNAATTCAHSPIAPPTRLPEPERTSRTANTPGTEVSSCEIGRPKLRSDCAPVTTKPARSSVTPQPSSQPVAGSAPTNRNRL